MNLVLNTDSYKLSHFRQYPEGTEYVYSYIESRGGKFDSTLFFGLQAFIKKYLMKPITIEDVMEAKEFAELHGTPFNYDGWVYILVKHMGYLPVEIRAVPEGTVVNTGNVLLTIVNTDPTVPWLTSYLETALLRAIWYPTTVATKSWNIKQKIKEFYAKTSDADTSEIDFKLVDFGARGVSSEESAEIGGMAHLVNFKVTDTISGVLAARRYYHEKMAGYSIPAAEHSTITSWGKENESRAYENMINQFGQPGKTFAVVSDSYDIWNAVENIWGKELRQKVNDSGATLVVRPDSGDPVQTPIDVISELMNHYGYTSNSKGYSVLPKQVRVLQGDGINEDTVASILEQMQYRGLSAENITFGMGGGLLQQVDRDTQKFAMKCSAIQVKGEWRDVYKEAPGKASKRGRLALIPDTWFVGKYQTVPAEHAALWDVMRLVYRNGDLMTDDTFQEIRDRSNG